MVKINHPLREKIHKDTTLPVIKCYCVINDESKRFCSKNDSIFFQETVSWRNFFLLKNWASKERMMNFVYQLGLGFFLLNFNKDRFFFLSSTNLYLVDNFHWNVFFGSLLSRQFFYKLTFFIVKITLKETFIEMFVIVCCETSF